MKHPSYDFCIIYACHVVLLPWTGSPDIFAARKDAGLPLSLSASRRPSFGLNYGGLIYPQTGECHDLLSAFQVQ